MMLAQRAPTAAARRTAAPKSVPALSRRSVVRRADNNRQRVEELKENAVEAGEKVRDAFQSSAPRPRGYDSDPKGVNQPVVDASQMNAEEAVDRIQLNHGSNPLRGPPAQFDNRDEYRAAGGWLVPSFTRRREIAAGRLAITGFFAAVFVEIFGAGHPGPLAQLSGYTGLTTNVLAIGFLGLVVHGLAGVITPTTQSRENKEDVSKRPTGLNDGVSPGDLGNALGVSDSIGFTKKNELFNGRMAMLGFFFAILGELRGGGGVVSQIAHWLGNEPTEMWFTGAGKFLAAWSLFLLGTAWINGRMGEIEGDESVY